MERYIHVESLARPGRMTILFLLIAIGYLSMPGIASAERGIELALHSRVTIVKNDGTDEYSEGFADFKQGLSHGLQKQYEQAIESFNRAEAKGLKTFELFLLRGQAYQELKRYKEALRDASRAIDMQPSNGFGYQLRANIYQSTENWKGSINDLSTGIKVASGNLAAGLYQSRGIVYLRLGKRVEAIEDFSEALSLGNVAPVVYYKRGRALAELGRYTEAINDFSEALSKEQGHYRSRLNRGWVYGCIGEFKSSIEDFNRLLSENSEDALARGLRGWVRLEDDDVEGGLSDLTYAAEHGFSDPLTYLNIASAFYLKGALGKALDANTKALTYKNPEYEAALSFQRGLLLLVSGEERKAKIMYGRARDRALKTPDRIVLQDAIGDLEEAMNTHSEIKDQALGIVTDLKEAVEKMPKVNKLSPKRCQQPRRNEE